MKDVENRYWAFMVRLYGEGESGLVDWRASLENPHTGARFAFASLDALFAFIQERTKSSRTVEASSPPQEKSHQRGRLP